MRFDYSRRGSIWVPSRRIIPGPCGYHHHAGGFAKKNAIAIPPREIAWWHHNESSGLSSADASGNGITGTLTNMEDPGDWVGGHLNNCLQFDGVNEFVDIGDNFDWERTQAWSVSAWFNSSTASSICFAGRLASSPADRGWMCGMFGAPAKMNLYVGNQTAPSAFYAQALTTNTGWADGTWRLVVFTYDGTGSFNGMRIYVDNVNEALTQGQNSLGGRTILNSEIATLAAAYSGASFLLPGLLDEVRVYDFVLDAADVAFLWNSGSGTEAQLPPP